MVIFVSLTFRQLVLIRIQLLIRSRTKGMGYVISFGIGQLIVTIVLWIFRYMYNLHENQCNFSKAFSALPSLHLKEMWLAGCLCGSLWEIANVGSIVAVQFLGVGVGYSVVQSAFLVSGKSSGQRNSY